MATTAPATKTLIEQYNERVSANVVADLFKTMTWVKRATLTLTAIIMLASYGHQVAFFTDHGAGPWAWVMPTPLDMLMLVIMKVSQLHGIKARNRRIARYLLILPALASAAINFYAHGDLAIRTTFAGFVLGIAIGDFVLGLIKPDFAEIEKTVTEVAAPTQATARRCEPGCTCGKHTRKTAAKPTRTRKAPAARKPRAPKLDAEFAALAAGSYPADAPVSPSPYL